MSDPFATWKMLQDQVAAAQKAQLDLATRMMGMGGHYETALRTAQTVAEANGKAWETWMGMWGMRK